MTGRCGKPMRFYEISRPRDYDPAPSCGRPPHQGGQCVTTEAYRRYLRRHAERARARRAGMP